MRVRKRPVEVEAVCWTGNIEDADELRGIEGRCADAPAEKVSVDPKAVDLKGCWIVSEDDQCVLLPTLEGVMKCEVGSWIIKGVNGEFYPCKPDIFEKTYDVVKDEDPFDRLAKECIDNVRVSFNSALLDGSVILSPRYFIARVDPEPSVSEISRFMTVVRSYLPVIKFECVKNEVNCWDLKVVVGNTEGHGASLIAEERRRQIEEEGFDAAHDDDQSSEDLVAAATSYALQSIRGRYGKLIGAKLEELQVLIWPWADKWWKPKDELRNLIRAGALISAAIDRIKR